MDIGDAEDNSIENDAPLDAAAEDNESNCNSNSIRSKNDPGKTYCAAFTWKQTVQVAEHLFATVQVFWLALTNLLRVLGCRPSSLHTVNFDRTMQSSFDLLAKHLWRVRTEYSKNHNVPQCFAVAMDITNPILCPLVGVAIGLAHIKPCLAIDKARDTLLGVLYASTRATTSGAQPKSGPKTLPSDRTLREQFKAHVVNSLAPSTSSSNNHQYLSLYSYRKFMVTHLVNAFHCNELHAKARAGWVEFQRQATAHAAGSTTAASWVSSVDVSTHYVSLESAGDERMALILSGRHPDAPYKNYMLDWLACNCPAEVVEQLAEAIFPANVRACFRSDDASSSSSLQRVLVYALLIAKAKIRPEMLAAFAQHNGLFERGCFEQPVVQKLLNRLRTIPLYPYAEPNTTYLSYLQQGRFAHYEVNGETGSLEAIEFVKKPARVVCGPLEEEDVGDKVDEECGGDSAKDLRQTQLKRKLLKNSSQPRADEAIDALAEGVIDLALDSSEEEAEEEREEAEPGSADEAQDSRHGSCLDEKSPGDNNDNSSHGSYLAEGSSGDSNNNDSRARKCADVDVNGVVEVEAAFAARLGYDRATNTVHLTAATDAFMSDVLVALQRHYNTRGPLRELLHTIFRQWEQQVSDDIPALQLWPEAGMHALKRASLASKNKVASRLHYAYISRRDIVKFCRRHFVTLDKAVGAFEEAKVCSLKEVKAYCKGL